MAHIPSKVLDWRARLGEGKIMKPSTFAAIERKAMIAGYDDPKAVAGKAYWATAKAKYKKAHNPSFSSPDDDRLYIEPCGHDLYEGWVYTDDGTLRMGRKELGEWQAYARQKHFKLIKVRNNPMKNHTSTSLKSIRYFQRASTSPYIGKSHVKTQVDHWKWIRGKGLFVKFMNESKYVKSEYTLPELLTGQPEGKVVEILKSNPVSGPADKEAARELVLFIENDGQLYKQQTLYIIKNLCLKKKKGTYKHDLAIKLWMYLMENGAKKYIKEHGSPGDKWQDMFNKNTRLMAAKEFTDYFESEYENGQTWLIDGKWHGEEIEKNPFELKIANPKGYNTGKAGRHSRQISKSARIAKLKGKNPKKKTPTQSDVNIFLNDISIDIEDLRNKKYLIAAMKSNARVYFGFNTDKNVEQWWKDKFGNPRKSKNPNGMTQAQVREMFRSEVLPEVMRVWGSKDRAAIRTAFVDFIDHLAREGAILESQAQRYTLGSNLEKHPSYHVKDIKNPPSKVIRAGLHLIHGGCTGRIIKGFGDGKWQIAWYQGGKKKCDTIATEAQIRKILK